VKGRIGKNNSRVDEKEKEEGDEMLTRGDFLSNVPLYFMGEEGPFPAWWRPSKDLTKRFKGPFALRHETTTNRIRMEVDLNGDFRILFDFDDPVAAITVT
jgi:hypothetical protein